MACCMPCSGATGRSSTWVFCPGAELGFGTAINDLFQFIAAAPSSYFPPEALPLPAGHTLDRGVGLNNSSRVAGSLRNVNSGAPLPFIYENGVLTTLPPLIPGGYGTAIDINNLGQVLVAAQKTQSEAVPVIYQGTNIVVELTAALVAASFRMSSQGTALNDRGRVVGSGEVTLHPRRGAAHEAVHAFLYRDGIVSDLKPLPGHNYSQAWSVNEADDVVGASLDNVRERSTAALWRGGRTYDLSRRVLGGTQGWKLLEASGINNDGIIVGTATKNNERQAFLLEPIGRRGR